MNPFFLVVLDDFEEFEAARRVLERFGAVELEPVRLADIRLDPGRYQHRAALAEAVLTELAHYEEVRSLTAEMSDVAPYDREQLLSAPNAPGGQRP